MIGQTFGSYRITGQIGAGGMGVVYGAEHVTLGGRAALKVLLHEFSQNPDMVARIFSEARAAAQIDHPGLVRVFDHGYMPNGSAYIVMELLSGESLARRLERERKMSVEDAVAIVRQVASAVGAAHDKGIVHRDLKPDNVFLVPDPELAVGVRAKVLDFGIAKLAGDGHGAPMRTRTGMLMGTPAYMSPEQCRGAGAVDTRADIYSLGCILFELLAGRPPFVLAGVGEIIAAQLYAPAPLVRSLEPSLPSWVELVIARMLAKSPDERQQTMAEVVGELGGRRVTVPPVHDATGGQTAIISAPKSYPLISVSPTPAETVLEKPPRPRSRLGFVVGGALLASAAIAVVLAAPRGDSPPVVAAAAPAPVAAAAAAVEVASPLSSKLAQVSAPVPAEKGETGEMGEMAKPFAPADVRLSVTSAPAGAEVFRLADGVRVGKTPLVMTVPRTQGTAMYLVKLAGYQDEKVELDADHDSAAKAALVKIQRKEPKPVKKTKIQDGALDPFAQ